MTGSPSRLFTFLCVAAGIVGHLSSDARLAARQEGQAACKPPGIEIPRDQIMFTEAQEADLGDAIADQLVRDFRLIDDDAVAGRLRAIGERLVKTLPASGLRHEFFLIEMADASAFVLPGGRVFVSTRLVGTTQTEDELAAVVAHELGHLLARQQAVFLSRVFKRVLNIDQVGDRADIFEKYHQLLDNAARNPGAFVQSDSHQNSEQVAADRLGLFVLAAAGYEAAAFTRFYDRFVETKGKTGGFFSNLFGTTPPESRRLRELIEATGTLPPACVSARAGDAAGYRDWKERVVTYTGRGRKESLHGVISRTRLDPALRGQVRHLRFSADGQLVLAQDDAGISVLSREPFSVLFRIDATGAGNAAITPDSRRIAFLTGDLRVETWSVPERRQEQRADPIGRRSCLQIDLSRNAATIACLEAEGLTLIEVPSGAPIVERREFALTLLAFVNQALRSAGDDAFAASFINMQFSPDGRFFAAGYARGQGDDVGFAFDLQTRTPVALKPEARRLLAGGFTFTGPDRLVGLNYMDSKKSGAVSLASGDVVERFLMFPGQLAASAKGPLVFVRPFDKYAVGVMDVARGQVVKGIDNPAIDIHDDVFVLERGTGELGLYDVAGNKLRTSATLPASPLGRVRASAVSADFRWLALSDRSRGGTWDLASGKQVTQMRGFLGAWLGGADLVADLPGEGGSVRQLVRANLDRREGGVVMPVKPGSTGFLTAGGFVAARYIFHEYPRRDIEVEAHDVRTAALLWKKTYAAESLQVLGHPTSETTILTWQASGRIASEEARRAAPLRSQRDALKETDGDYFLQMVDTRTGTVRGAMFVETGRGSFQIRNVSADADWVVVEDSEGRTRVYSLSTGAEKGRVFGTRATLSATAGLLAVENGDGKLFLYDLVTLQRRGEQTFSHPVSTAAFSADGKRLFVLTSDQTAYVLSAGGQ